MAQKTELEQDIEIGTKLLLLKVFELDSKDHKVLGVTAAVGTLRQG
jgi:hypothetical protein